MQIHYAAAQGDIDEVKRQLSKGVNVDVLLTAPHIQEEGVTPLMFAAKSPYAQVDMLQLLVENGANVNAASGGKIKGRDIPAPEDTPLTLAAKSGSVAKVQFLLKAGADIHYETSQRYTALINGVYGTHKSRVEVVKLLLNAGANPNIVTDYRESPLSVAMYFANFEVLHILLDRGADPAPLEWTPLMRAVVLGTLDDVRRELANESAHEKHGRFGRSAWLLSLVVGDLEKAKSLRQQAVHLEGAELSWAVRKDNPEIVRWLLSIGANPNTTDEYGYTPLIEATRWGSTECVRILIEAGANVEAENHVRSKAIDTAANEEIVKLLVDAGADLNYVNGQGYSLLKSAAESGDIEMVRALLKLGADPNASNRGETPLYVAVHSDECEIVKLLLQAGADPNIRTVPDDWYPLQNVKSIKTLQLLLDAGADVLYRDYWNKLPVDSHDDPEIVAILKRAEKEAIKKSSKGE